MGGRGCGPYFIMQDLVSFVILQSSRRKKRDLFTLLFAYMYKNVFYVFKTKMIS